ncbi:hypothetical protein [Rhodoblastus sp.]|uniref:hypothetical protein n=1 Tax=Rhodoblastus sp. TaxID=1962975 RepID=UPI0035AE639D
MGAIFFALGATLCGCAPAPPPPIPNAVVLPAGAIVPTRSLRTALNDCARYDPFRAAYVDKLATLPEPELSALARAGGPAHVACLRAIGWDAAPGLF